MGWYKVDIRHGPGHQARDVEYKYFDDEEWRLASEKEKKETAFEMVVEHWWEDSVGDVTKIAELPEEIRQNKIAEYTQKRNDANKMLDMLVQTAPHKYYALVCSDGDELQGVVRDDGISDNEDLKNLIEITKEQFDIFIESEDDRKPTFPQLTKERCADCEDTLGIDERLNRKCYKCFVRPHKVLD